MSEYRVKTTLKDNSQTVSLSSSTVGFTSIEALKGIEKPILIETGETQKILDSFGYPSASYPGIQDVINYNSAYPLWVSAPFDSTTAKHGGVLITKQGSVGLASGLASPDIADFSAIVQEEQIAIGDGTTTVFNFTTKLFDYYENQSIDILIDDVSQAVTATDAEPELLSTVGGDSGSYTRATGVLAYTFASAPLTGEVIKVQYTIDVSLDCYFALLSKGGQVDDLAVKVTDSGSTGTFILELNRQDVDDLTVYNSTPLSPYEVSIVAGTKNGFGQQIYLDNIFDEDNYYVVPVINLTTFDTFVDDTVNVPFAGGERGDALDPSDIVAGFDYLTDVDTYSNISIIFDVTGESAVVTEFETLRGTDATPGSQGRSKFLVPVTNQSVATTLTDTASAKNNVENRGINFFANSWCKHKDLYNDTPFIVSGMGTIAKKYSDSKAQSFGALSPMYIDENGIGGQLGSGILELVNTASETQLEQLDTAGLIGIKKISGSGFTIVGDRTSQSTILSDYSYTIHSDLADFIIKNVEEQILPQQIGKPNDELHRTNVRAKAELIMESVDQYLEEYDVKCDLGNNTDDIRAQRKFVLTIGVIFTPNSQKIDFIFVNSRVGTDITQVINKS